MRRLALATALAALALPAAAGAHVTLQPTEAPAGAYVVENVRVPNERDDASTKQVVVQFPSGFASASTAPVLGWTAGVVTTKNEVVTITWEARGDAKIGPGQFQDFPVSVQMPEEEGPLTFKAIQTYDDGEVVRWIGDEASDKPAPIVTVTAAAQDSAGGQDLHSEQTQEAAAPETAAPAPAAAATAQDDSDTLAIVALIVGGLGLLVGVAGFVTARKAGSA